MLTYVHQIVQQLTSHTPNDENVIMYYYILWRFFCYIGVAEAEDSETTEQYIIETLTQEHIDGFLYYCKEKTHNQKLRYVVLSRYLGLLDLPFEVPQYVKRQRNITSNNVGQYNNKHLRNRLICAIFKDLEFSRSIIQNLTVAEVATCVDGYWLPDTSLRQSVQDLVELYLNQRSGQAHLDYRDTDSTLLFVSSHSAKKMKLNSISKIIRNSMI